MMQGARASRWPTFLGAVFLTYLVCAVFFPIVGFEFIDLDVDDQVVENPHIRGLSGENLKQILTSRCSRSYYPVRALTFAVDYQIWGLNPGGFKLTNGLIHLANVLLVFWLLLRLLRRPAAAGKPPETGWDTCVAAFSAGVFAVHPVVVEPVTWVAGREELLMTLGALGCIHFHVTARRLGEAAGSRRRAVACHACAAFCCAAACLSNAVAAVIPLLITAWDVLMLRRPKLWRIVCGTAALWAIGMATVVLKKLGEGSNLADQPGAFSAERLMLVLNVYWLNLKTLVCPKDLALTYERIMPESFFETEVVLGGMAIGLTCLVFCILRRRNLVFFGLLWFCMALAPASQIMPHHVRRADRFLYLPLAGLMVAIAISLRPLRNALKGRAAVAGVIATGVLGLVLLDFQAAEQVQTWRTRRSLWEYCLSVVPRNYLAHRALADNLAYAGRFDQALEHYRIALWLHPDSIETLNNFALHLAGGHNEALRDYQLAIELAERGCELTEWKDQKLLHTLAMAYNNFAVELEHGGEFRRAIGYYNKSRKVEPGYKDPVFNLALLLATCRHHKLRRADEAVRLAEQACEMVEYSDANGLWILAKAYAEVGRPDMAVTTIQKAIGLAQAADDAKLVDQLQSQLRLYQDCAKGHEMPRPARENRILPRSLRSSK